MNESLAQSLARILLTNVKAASPQLVMAVCLTLGLSQASAQPAKAVPAASENIELYDYTVKSGDTCAGIARRELGDRKAYKTIHKHNRMGPLPHRLEPGTVLKLPRIARTPDAVLESRVGKVEYRKATETLWVLAAKGMDIFRSWRVWSHKRSTAVLVFRDDSVLSLRNDTIVVIYGPSARDGKKQIVRAELETGSLRSRLAALESSLLVETDTSEVTLGSGSTVISATPAKNRAAISNHEGKSVSVRRRSRKKSARLAKAVTVAPGKGTWVDKDKEPAPPIDLPPSPELTKSPPLHVSLASSGTVLRGSWKPVQRAERYRVEVATDPNVRIVVAAFEVTKDVTSFEARGLNAGKYYVSVASIDDKGLESAPSPRQPVRVALLQHQPRPGQEHMAQGSSLIASEGVKCTTGDASPSASLALRTPGAIAVRCTGPEGEQSAPLNLTVAGWQVDLAGQEGTTLTAPRAATTEFLLQPSPALRHGAKVTITGAEFASAEVLSAGPEGVRISLTPTSEAPARGDLHLSLDSEAGALPIATVTVVVPPAATKRPAVQRRVAVGLGAGAFYAGLETSEVDPSVAPYLGALASIQLVGRLELELETRLARRGSETPSYFAHNQVLLAWRHKVSSSTFLRGRAGPSLWLHQDPGGTSVTELGLSAGIGLEQHVGNGALRFDFGGFALGGAPKRLSAGISYAWDMDLLP